MGVTVGPMGRTEHAVRVAWPALLALLAIGLIYGLVSDSLRLGPPWLLPALILAATAVWVVARRRGHHRLAPWLPRAVTVAITGAVIGSAVLLVSALPSGRAPAPRDLLRDAALIWVSNVLTFALWYWHVDGGGPAHRKVGEYRSTDFVFPQLAGQAASETWTPGFIDYVFLAFNTSTAFSPTDTMVLSKRAKLLMMAQSLISLVVIGVLLARAINTL
jgi:hypothetical protein